MGSILCIFLYLVFYKKKFNSSLTSGISTVPFTLLGCTIPKILMDIFTRNMYDIKHVVNIITATLKRTGILSERFRQNNYGNLISSLNILNVSMHCVMVQAHNKIKKK